MRVNRIVVPAGPEDIELIPNSSSLIVSSTDRASCLKKGAISIVDLDSKLKSSRIMKIKDFTGNYSVLRPHGISIRKVRDSNYLYVISHEKEKDTNTKIDAVHVFKIVGDELHYKRNLAQSDGNGLIRKLNDLDVLPDGTVYASDAAKSTVRSLIGKTSRVLVYSPSTDSWSIFGGGKRHFRLANGVYADKSHLFVSDFTSKKLYVFDRRKQKLEYCIQSPYSLDNITPLGKDLLIPAISANPIRSILVMGLFKKKHLPSVVMKFKFNSQHQFQGKYILMNNSGYPRLSATSAALYHNGSIYTGHIFADYLSEISRPNFKKMNSKDQ